MNNTEQRSWLPFLDNDGTNTAVSVLINFTDSATAKQALKTESYSACCLFHFRPANAVFFKITGIPAWVLSHTLFLLSYALLNSLQLNYNQKA